MARRSDNTGKVILSEGRIPGLLRSWSEYLSWLQSFLFIQALYGLSMCTVKWSMLFMLKRIFAVPYFKV